MSFILNWKVHAKCFIIAWGIAVFLYDKIFAILTGYCENPLTIWCFKQLLPEIYINFMIMVVIAMIPITVIHEIFHGLAYKLFGGQLKYGFRGFYVYTMEVSGRPMARIQFCIILLAPVLMISFISLFITGWIGDLVFVLNLLGSSADIYMALGLLKYEYGSKFIDRTYGYDVIKSNCQPK